MSMLKFFVLSLLWIVSVVMFFHFFDPSLVIYSCLILLGIAICIGTRHIKYLSIAPLLFFISMLLYLLNIEARNDRIWWQGMEKLAQIEMTAEKIKINNLRNYNWQTTREPDQNWETREYDLSKLATLDLIIVPFKDLKYMAHTMLSFGFEGQGHVVVSVEARKENHEEYGLIAGALKQFELIYIFGDERDLMGLRAIQRADQVYLYPIKAEQNFIQDLFKQVATSANQLYDQPQFYKSVRSNCTTTLVKHIDQFLEQKIGFRYQTLFPALAGELLYELGYMDTEQSFAEVKLASRIDADVRQYIKEPKFSAKIRE